MFSRFFRIRCDDAEAGSGSGNGFDEDPAATQPIETSSGMNAKMDLPLLLVGLFGFGVGIYLLLLHLKGKVSGGALSCDFNSWMNCTNVILSEHGALVGIPLGAFGAAFFAIVIAIAILPKVAPMSLRYHSFWRLVVASVGLLVSVALEIDMLVILGSFCPWCFVTHVLSLLVFLYSLVLFFKHRSEGMQHHPEAFLRMVSLGLAFSVPPLLAGFLLGNFAEKLDFLKPESATASVVQQIETKAAESKREPIGFSRSPYVGKGEDYRLGNDNAKVVIQVFSDYECPACRQAERSLKIAVETLGKDKVLLIYRNYPLSKQCNPEMQREMHPTACALALATRCAGAQGKFWEFADWAFGLQDVLDIGEREKYVTPENLKKEVEKLGGDGTRFAECFVSKREMPKILDDIAVAKRLNLRGTPLVLINDQDVEINFNDPQEIVRQIEPLL